MYVHMCTRVSVYGMCYDGINLDGTGEDKCNIWTQGDQVKDMVMMISQAGKERAMYIVIKWLCRILFLRPLVCTVIEVQVSVLGARELGEGVINQWLGGEQVSFMGLELVWWWWWGHPTWRRPSSPLWTRKGERVCCRGGKGMVCTSELEVTRK